MFQILCLKRQIVNWDHGLSDSKAQSLNHHATNVKESSLTGSIFGDPDEWMGVLHHITSLIRQRRNWISELAWPCCSSLINLEF